MYSRLSMPMYMKCRCTSTVTWFGWPLAVAFLPLLRVSGRGGGPYRPDLTSDLTCDLGRPQLCRGRGFHCAGCAERWQQRWQRRRRQWQDAPAPPCCCCLPSAGRLRSAAARLSAQWRRFVHQLCCGRAFHCESCHHQQVLFPFEVPEVRQCAGCGACYHYLCFPEAAGCARCRRIELRRRASAENV